METQTVQIFAGAVATIIFVSSNLPMVWKAIKTKNLSSYSLTQIGLSNTGNAINWLYILGLPFGPIWLLHGFNTIVAIFMLGCYLHYEKELNHEYRTE